MLQSDNTLAGALRRRGQDRRDDRRRDGDEAPRACAQAHDRRAQSSGRAVGRGVSRALPAGQIFVAGKDAFAAGNRQKAMSRIATGNYDAVIVSHSSFEKLPVSDETFERFVGQADRAARRGDLRGQGRERRQPPHREGAGESQEAPHDEAERPRRPREQGRRRHLRADGHRPLFVDESRPLQESRLRERR